MFGKLILRHLFITGLTLMVCLPGPIKAQGEKSEYAPLLTPPRGYVCYRTTEPVKIDGVLDEKSWQYAPWTENFCDISGAGFPTPYYDTRAKLLWDSDNLYIAAEMEEENIWALQKRHDDIVWHDPDFEVFIDPKGDGHNYFEIEVNALGTVFDLSLEAPYRSKIRPFVQFQYNAPGLEVGIQREGTLNYPQDKDKEWIIEMKIPRQALASEFDDYLRKGSYLRLDFSRVEWQVAMGKEHEIVKKTDSTGKQLPEENWVWSPTGRIDMHMPERWGYVYLSDQISGSGTETFAYPKDESARRFLWRLFYGQETHYRKTHTYLKHLEDFHLTKAEMGLLPEKSRVDIETTSHAYEINLSMPDGSLLAIDDTGRCFYR